MKEQTSYRKELTGVFGYPVDENPTVVMIEAGFAALNLPWRYLNLKVPPKDLPSAVNGLRAMGFRGINLTIPHKCEVIKYLDEVADDARIMGAVNTVYVLDGRLIGANTDGKGFLRALNDDAKLNPAGKKFVVLGAGGAARAITVELALAGAAEIVIVNRSEARGVSPRIVARQDLKFWHGLGTLLYTLQWACALVTLWHTLRKSQPPQD